MKAGGDLAGHMGVDIGGGDTAMAEQILDDPDIFAALQKVGGVGMAQSMDCGRFVDAALPDRLSERDLQVFHTDMAVFTGEEKTGADAILPAMRPQQFQRPIGKMDIPVFATLAVLDPEEMPLAVDVACR